MYEEQHKYQKLYGSQRWRKIALYQLKRFPTCKICEDNGIIYQAEVADHIEPHDGDQNKFWFGKLQSLCHSHHNSTKKQLENKGYVNDIGDDGYPIDKAHPFNIKSNKK